MFAIARLVKMILVMPKKVFTKTIFQDTGLGKIMKHW